MPPRICNCVLCRTVQTQKIVYAEQGIFKNVITTTALLDENSTLTKLDSDMVATFVASSAPDITPFSSVPSNTLSMDYISTARLVVGTESTGATSNVTVASSNPDAVLEVVGTSNHILIGARNEILMDEIWTISYPPSPMIMAEDGASQTPLLDPLKMDHQTICSYTISLQSYGGADSYETVPPEAVMRRSNCDVAEMQHLIGAQPGSVWAVTRLETFAG